jgi:type IV secretion system protein VirD4
VIETLVAGGVITGVAAARTVYRRQRAALLAPEDVLRGHRYAPRLATWKTPTDPINVGIIPCRPILGMTHTGHYWQAAAGHGVAVFGPPRKGKTAGFVIPNALAWPGPQVVTSARVEVFKACWRACLQNRRQVWLFDPLGEWGGPLPPGVRRLHWSPLRRADDADTSWRRARALTENVGEGVTDGNHFKDGATRLLAPLLRAAALEGLPMSAVCLWTDLMNPRPAFEILERHGRRTERTLSQLAGIVRLSQTNPKEVASFWSTLQNALLPFISEAVLDSADFAEDCPFDPKAFLTGRDSIFVVAPEGGASDSIAPLVVGLVTEIYWAVRELCTEEGWQALRVPLHLLLDEVANICPLKMLPELLSAGGGRGVITSAIFQDLPQVGDRWGEEFERSILTTAGAKLFLPGLADDVLLTRLSMLCGPKLVKDLETDAKTKKPHRGDDGEGRWHVFRPTSRTHSTTTRQVPIWSPSDIREMGDGTALLINSNGKPEQVTLPLHFRNRFLTDCIEVAVPEGLTVHREPQRRIAAPVTVSASAGPAPVVTVQPMIRARQEQPVNAGGGLDHEEAEDGR